MANRCLPFTNPLLLHYPPVKLLFSSNSVVNQCIANVRITATLPYGCNILMIKSFGYVSPGLPKTLHFHCRTARMLFASGAANIHVK